MSVGVSARHFDHEQQRILSLVALPLDDTIAMVKMHGRAEALRALRGCLYVVLLIRVASIEVESTNYTDIAPYLLFTTQTTIFRHYLSSNSTEVVLTPTQLGIIAISYHYRLDSMFWINTLFLNPSIMVARLDGSGEREIDTGHLESPVDLTVDWLNDRLYWIDSVTRQVEEYDLKTGHRAVVLTTGEAGTSSPAALTLLPYPNYGWIYWSDRKRKSLEKASVTGDDRSILRSGFQCKVEALTIDYPTIYWIDHCWYVINSLRLDGDPTTHRLLMGTTIVFPNGLAIYNDTLFWSEHAGVFQMANKQGAIKTTLYSTAEEERCTGLQLVHSSRQPNVEQYLSIITGVSQNFTFRCTLECVHGECIFPGLCACDAGWRGEQCDTDVNECERQAVGCKYQCSNTVGSFQCVCPVGYILAEDGLLCEDVNECTIGNGGCQQLCHNQRGTYTCNCTAGYFLKANGANCTDKLSSVRSLTPSAMSLDVMSSKPPHTSDIFSSTKTLARSSISTNTHHTSISLITKTSNHSSSLPAKTTRILTSTGIPDNLSSASLTPSAVSLDMMSSKPPHTSDTFSSSFLRTTKTLAQSISAPTTIMLTSTGIPDNLSSASLTPSAVSLDMMSSKPPHTSDAFYSSFIRTTKTLAQSSITSSNPHHTSISPIARTSRHSSSFSHFTRPTISTAASRSQENRVSERLHLMSTDTGRVFDTVTSRDVKIFPTQVRISSTAVPDPPYKEDDNGEETGSIRGIFIVAAVSTVAVCLITAAVVILAIMPSVERERHRKGSFTPVQQHRPMIYNTSVTRLAVNVSYTPETYV